MHDSTSRHLALADMVYMRALPTEGVLSVAPT